MTAAYIPTQIESPHVVASSPEKSALVGNQEAVCQLATRDDHKLASGQPSRADSTTPVSSGSGLTPEYEEGPLWSDAQQLRVTCAEAYEIASQNFLAAPTPESLEQLSRALAKTHSQDVDPISAERILSCSQDFLKSDDVVNNLLACQLVVRYELKRAETPSFYSVASPELCITKFRQLSKKEDLNAMCLPLLTETVELWTALAEQGDIEEHQGYHLIASSLHWVFNHARSSTETLSVRYRFMNLLVATYSRMPKKGRYKTVHDLLTMMLRFSGPVSDAVHLILRLVAVTGSVPMSIWTEATSLRKRHIIEADASLRHKEAIALCQMISRKIIEFAYINNGKGSGGTSSLMQGFLDECVSALMSPQTPSTEVFLSSFISTLFTLSQTHSNRKYCVFSFSVLRVLQETLALFRNRDLTAEFDPVPLVAAVQTLEQANYLASRQCTLPNQPYFDLHLAVKSPRTAQRTTVHVSESEWVSFLGQWPISAYYEHICEHIRALADRDDIPDTIQVELFKVLEKVVTENPCQFNSRWLDRLSYASASVCEALVPVIAAAFHGLEPKNYDMLHKMGTRLAVPGVKPFKKRAIALFSSISDASSEAYETAWLYLLISIADTDPSVSQAASERAVSMFFAALQDETMGSWLSTALLAARSKAGENTYLVQDGLRKLVSNLSASKEGPRVRRLVSSLLQNGEVELAALLVEADGTFMPLAKISSVFDEVRTNSATQMASLRMLCAALCARPRIILSPATASAMFGALLAKLKTSTEAEIGYVGPILRELVMLGGPQVQHERIRKLGGLIDTTYDKLCQFDGIPNAQPSLMAVLRQLIMITGCVRFWGHRKGLEKASNVVEKLVALGRQAEAGSSLSQLIVRTVFSTAAEYRVLFNNKCVDDYLSSLRQGCPEFDCFMQMLFQYNWHETETEDPGATVGADAFKSMIMGTSQKEEVLATSSMLQKYLAHVLQQADRDQNVVALRIISKALDHYLVVVDRCLPVVVSLCFSSKLSVAQAALATYAKMCSRWPGSVLTKLVPGLKRCSDLGELRTGPFARVWQLAKGSQNQRNIKMLIEAVVTSLRHDCSDTYAKLVISGLMQTPLEPKDAKLLRLGLVESVFSFSPRNKAHEAPHIARMILVHVFETWLTRRYGLVTAKQVPEDATELEALEYVDIDAIMQRFRDDRKLAQRAFEELLDEQYTYGSREMDELVYGKRLETPAGADGTVTSEVSKKRRMAH